ncbi:hypothetical protein ACSBR1_004186 [Camellia fascicularis]
MKKKGKKIQKIRKKEEVAEDWCFVCKDGGKLLVCEYKQCLKSYHADCVGLDESVFDTGNRWTCGLHSCFICEKDSKFHCYCCPTGVCQRCITGAEFTRVKGHKGFCNNCLKLALLGEENMDVDSDGEKVDFKDRETYEGLFMEYWEIIKEEEGLTLEHLHAADAQLKKGENYKSGSRRVESNKDEENQSDYDDEDDDEIEEPKLVQKVKRSKRHKKREVKSNKREFIGWGSKSLIDFLSSIGKDARKRLSQYDISSIINGYINENKLFRPEKKNKILCDERLKSVLGRKSINRNKIYDLLEPHLLENLDLSEEDEVGNSSEDEEESVLVASKKQRKLSSCRKSQEKGVVFDAPLSWFAAIVAENIKLVFLKRSLVQELLKKPETFEDKVIGSFVRVKSEPSDSMQGFSHQLVQVTGMKKPSPGESNSEILLQVSNMSKDIRINMLSEDNFSEEECEDLKQKVKAGLLKRPTMLELEQKAKTLHEDITKHWIAKELALLQNLIDRANEKGWRAELFEYLERRQLLQKPSEQLRLLQKVPRALADISDFEPTSQKSMLKGSSETPGDNNGGNGISLGDGAVTNGNSSFGNIGSSSANDGNGNGNVQATQGNNAGCNIQVAPTMHQKKGHPVGQPVSRPVGRPLQKRRKTIPRYPLLKNYQHSLMLLKINLMSSSKVSHINRVLILMDKSKPNQKIRNRKLSQVEMMMAR